MSLEATSPTTWSLVVGGLLLLAFVVYGLRDLARFSLYRTWAISGVVFSESVRRKVLWVTPLAMVAVLLMVQLQDPADEADAIRQALRACLFASGVVAVVISLILSCTNLPREITNRVIFTLVTKPLTRFELLLGKVIGFARLSAVVLLIMGLFTWILLSAMEWRLLGRIESALGTQLPVEGRRPHLEELAEDGLLQARRTDAGDDLQIYAEPPADPADTSTSPRYYPAGAYFAAYPFVLDQDLIDAMQDDPSARLAVRLRLHWKLRHPDQLLPGDPPLGIVNLENLPPAPPPGVAIQILGPDLESLIAHTAIESNHVQLPVAPDVPVDNAPWIALSAEQTARVVDRAEEMRIPGHQPPPIYVAVYGTTAEYFYGAAPDSVALQFAIPPSTVLATVMPEVGDAPRSDVLLRTFLGTRGFGLSGPEEDQAAPFGILAFRDTPTIDPDDDGLVDIEIRAIVERLGGVLDETDDTLLEAQVHNVSSGFSSDPVILFPETGRPASFSVPLEAVEGGDFDLRLRTLSRGHIVSVRGAGVELVVDRQPFVLNLGKAMFVQWLLSILVITAGLAFSTFVSWPVAVTLTIVGLVGRWVAGQLGDLDEGWGRQAAEGIFGAGGDVGAKETLRVGVDALTDFFRIVTAFLPDMSRFGVTDLLERGHVISWAQIGSAAGVMAAFGLPLLALAYMVLRNKEVAP